MVLISLRTLTDNPAAEALSGSTPTYIFHADDYNKIKDAIQLGKTGIHTYSITCDNDIDIGGEANFDAAAEFADAVVFSDTVTFGDNVTFSDDVTVAVDKTIDGVDISDMSLFVPNIDTGTGKIPLTTITGATVAWTAHNHDLDGSAQINTSGLANNAVTLAKLNSASVIGESAGQAFPASSGTALRSTFTALLNGDSLNGVIGSTYIPAEQFCGPTSGNNAEAGTFFDLTSNPLGSLTTVRLQAAKTTTAKGGRFQDFIPNRCTACNIRFVFGFDDAGGTIVTLPHTLTVEVTAIPLGAGYLITSPTPQDLYSDTITLTLFDGSETNIFGDNILLSNHAAAVPLVPPGPYILAVRFVGLSLPQKETIYIFGAVLEKTVTVS